MLISNGMYKLTKFYIDGLSTTENNRNIRYFESFSGNSLYIFAGNSERNFATYLIRVT